MIKIVFYLIIATVIATAFSAVVARVDPGGFEDDAALVIFIGLLIGACWPLTLPLGMMFGAVWLGAKGINGFIDKAMGKGKGATDSESRN